MAIQRTGPVPKFSDYHIWKTLLSLDSREAIGRKKLSSILGIGEGSTRTILKILEDEGFTKTEKGGVLITDKGMSFRDSIYFELCPITVSSLTIGTNNCAVRIPYSAKRVTFGCEERDIAIISGAKGATTLICSNGKIVFPGSDFQVDENTEIILRKNFRIRNDDVIIIGTAENYESAECGAVTAALNLMGGLDIGKKKIDVTSGNTTPSLVSLAFAVHELVGGLPVCAKGKDDLGIRIENGAVVDNAYTGDILEECLSSCTTIKKYALSGPYKGIRVIVTPIEMGGQAIAAIGVVDIRGDYVFR